MQSHVTCRQMGRKSCRETLKDIDIETVDLKELQLPQFEEPISPMMNPDRKPEGVVKQWLDTLASADGFVFITPNIITACRVG